MKRISYQDCNCFEGKTYGEFAVWVDCPKCDMNLTDLELLEEAYNDKYDLDEARMKGN